METCLACHTPVTEQNRVIYGKTPYHKQCWYWSGAAGGAWQKGK